nr:transposase [Streptomyces sp. 8K308]
MHRWTGEDPGRALSGGRAPAGHGALYAALDRGWLEPARLRRALAGLPLPRAADGRIVLAVDVSNWLRPDAPTSDQRLFCHIYGRGDRKTDQLMPAGRTLRRSPGDRPDLVGRAAGCRAPGAGGRRHVRDRHPLREMSSG